MIRGPLCFLKANYQILDSFYCVVVGSIFGCADLKSLLFLIFDVPLAQAWLHQSSEELAASGDPAHTRLL